MTKPKTQIVSAGTFEIKFELSKFDQIANLYIFCLACPAKDYNGDLKIGEAHGFEEGGIVMDDHLAEFHFKSKSEVSK